MRRIDIVSVATNVYSEYWRKMANSVVNNRGTSKEKIHLNLHVFTDTSLDLESLFHSDQNLKVCVHKIENLIWPDATLRRYELIQSISEHLTAEVLMYIDADMLVVADIWDEVYDIVKSGKLALVRHPGFWHDNWKKTVLSFVYVLEVLFPFFRIPKLVRGAWETRTSSTAYVPRRLRRYYFQAAIWFGPRNLVLNFVKRCSINTSIDSSKGIIAIYHDESHLNHWASFNRKKVERKDPSFCFPLNYEQIAHLTPKIIAVEKTVRTR